MKENRRRYLEQKLAESLHDIIDEFCIDNNLVLTKISFNLEIDEDEINSKYEITTNIKDRIIISHA